MAIYLLHQIKLTNKKKTPVKNYFKFNVAFSSFYRIYYPCKEDGDYLRPPQINSNIAQENKICDTSITWSYSKKKELNVMFVTETKTGLTQIPVTLLQLLLQKFDLVIFF